MAAFDFPQQLQRRFRIAFITSGFVTEQDRVSGLGSYLNKITRALRQEGHEPEIFVISHQGPGVIDYNGVRVNRVHPRAARGWLRWCPTLPRIRGLGNVSRAVRLFSAMNQLADAFEQRDRQQPFDLVQSADWEGVGLRIRLRPGLTHVLRCSVAADLTSASENPRRALLPALLSIYEFQSVRRASRVYAPSQWLADYYYRRLGKTVHVVRPPAMLDFPPHCPPVKNLPDRYLLHFGQLHPGKGAWWLAEALPFAWKQEPNLKLVIAGQVIRFDFDQWRRNWGPLEKNVIYLGQISKPEIGTVLSNAIAAVIPSLFDNLPNTAIESLLMGIPVIGTRGASIDELVEDGVHGELVAINDAPALANAMVRAWRGQSPVRKGYTWNSPAAQAMKPRAAVDALLQFAGLIPSPPNEQKTSSPTRANSAAAKSADTGVAHRNWQVIPASPSITPSLSARYNRIVWPRVCISRNVDHAI